MADVNARGTDSDSGRILAIIAYILFLIGWPTLHLATVAAVILAYIERGEVRGTIWESHFDNVIHTFWISLVIGVIVVPLSFAIIGIPLLIALVVWFLYRTVKGLIRVIDEKPYY